MRARLFLSVPLILGSAAALGLLAWKAPMPLHAETGGEAKETATEEGAPREALRRASADGEKSADGGESSGRVVARSGEYQLSLERLERAIAERPPELLGGVTEEALDALARRLLDEKILAGEARKRGMHLRFAHRRERDRRVVQTFLRETIDEPLLEKPITDEEIKAYYDENRAQFERPEMRRASHILVKSEARAKELISLIPTLKTGEIREIIRRESRDDRTRLSAGDLRFFDREGNAMRERDVSLHPAIAAAAFELEKVGDVYPRPIPVDGNFSVLILRGIRPERKPGWEAVRTRIESTLHANRREAAVKALARTLYQSTTTSMDEALLAKIRFDNAE